MTRSIQQLPNNSGSTSVVEVASSTGFNAGDLVYYRNGNYSNGSGLSVPSSLSNFSGTNPNTPIGASGALGGTIFNPNPVSAQTGSASGNYAATLTNGNIVQVYLTRTTGYPTFQIVNSTLTSVVVAATTVSTTYVNTNTTCSNIGVLALTGGGFVVYWINTAGGTALYPCYAIYTNSGAQTTAAQQDTAVGVASVATNLIAGVALSNSGTNAGGFALAYTSTTTVAVYTRAYNATGTSQYAWITVANTNVNANRQIGLASNSSNQTIVTINNSTGNTCGYGVYTPAGGTQVAFTTFTSATGIYNATAADVTTLSDGTTFVIAYVVNTSNPTVAFKFLPSPYSTLSAEYLIPNTNTYTNNAFTNFLKVQSLANGNFVIVFASGNTGSYQYSVFNSSGVCLSGTSGSTGTGAIPRVIYGSYSSSYGIPSILETTNAFYIFYTTYPLWSQYAIQVGETNNWFPIPVNSTSTTISGLTATPLAWSANGSTPTKAAFTTTAGSYSTISSLGSTVVGQTNISSTTAYTMSSTTLPNGNILFAVLQSSSTGPVVFYVYTPAGAFVSQTTVLSSVTISSTQGAFKVVALTSGKVALQTVNSTTMSLYLFTSAFVQIGSTATITITGAVSISNTTSISALGGDRYVVAYTGTTSYPNYAVYSNTNTQVSTGVVTSAALSNYNVIGFMDGSFAVGAYNSSGPQQTVYIYVNTTGNTFSQFNLNGPYIGVNLSSYYGPTPMVATPAGVIILLTLGNASSTVAYETLISGFDKYPSALSYTDGVASYNNTWGTSNPYALCGMNGNGMPIVLYLTTLSTGTYQLYAPTVYGNVAFSTTITLTNSATGFIGGSITPGAGNNFVLSYISSGLPTFTILTGSAAFVSNNPTYATREFAYVSSTGTGTASIYPNNTNITPAITNTVLAGVSVTSASAGGTGQVAINGLAQLNSNYSASTAAQAFDSTGQGVSGVKGTIVGTQVNLQGNS